MENIGCPVYEIEVFNKLFGSEIKYKLVFYEDRLEVFDTNPLLSRSSQGIG